MTELASTTELLVSELVTNAVQAASGHADQAAVRLRLSGDSTHVLIEVWDADPRPPAPNDLREDGTPDPKEEGGRGLFLVAALSARWEWYLTQQPAGKVVWCEIEALFVCPDRRPALSCRLWEMRSSPSTSPAGWPACLGCWPYPSVAPGFRIERLMFHLAGIPTYIVAAEVALNRVLRGGLPRPDNPDKLHITASQRWRADARLTLGYARGAHAARGHVAETAGFIATAGAQAAHAVLAGRGEWITNEKTLLDRAGLWSVDAVVSGLAADPEQLTRAVDAAERLLGLSPSAHGR